MPDIPLGREEILAHLRDVADALPAEGPRHTIVVVGGSLLAMHGLRQTTVDVDSVRRIDAELRAPIVQVAQLRHLAPAWLNDSATAFRPAAFDEAECEVLLTHGRLTVLGAPLRQVFVMKLNAARARDYDDLVVLWQACDFETAQQAVEMYRNAYPHEADDPYLMNFLRGLAD
ncbi:MAG: DUF6036 family nucleotidyltransferase [Anaerolineaceae bacterium]